MKTAKQFGGRGTGVNNDYIHVALPFLVKWRLNRLAEYQLKKLGGIVKETLGQYLAMNEPIELREQSIKEAQAALAAHQAEFARKAAELAARRNGKRNGDASNGQNGAQ
jgi:hypothetical protein